MYQFQLSKTILISINFIDLMQYRINKLYKQILFILKSSTRINYHIRKKEENQSKLALNRGFRRV